MADYDDPRPTSQDVGSTEGVVLKDNLITLDNVINAESGTEITNRKGESLTPMVDIVDSAESIVQEAVDAVAADTIQNTADIEAIQADYASILKAASLAVGCELEQIILATDTTTLLDDILYIYDATDQVTYAKPSTVGAGEVIASVADYLLTTDVTTYEISTADTENVVVTVESYGALPYPADSTAAFYNAITLNPGATILMLGKAYSVTGLPPFDNGTSLIGQGVGYWRTAPFANTGKYSLDEGTTIVMTGEGAKLYSFDFVSDCEFIGGVRTNPDPRFGTNDAEIRMIDFTNKDAVEATRATAKEFSCAIMAKPGNLGGNLLKDFRIIPNYDGVDGYNDNDTAALGDAWDVGICNNGARNFKTNNVQVVGYWRMAGTLHTATECYMQSNSSFSDNALGGATVAEHGYYEDHVTQGWKGFAFRARDIYPVRQTTTATEVHIPFFESHTFEPTGTLKLSYEGGYRTYSSLTYDAVNDELIFGGLNYDVELPIRTDEVMFTDRSLGMANTQLIRGEISSMDHTTRLPISSTEFGDDAMTPGACIEMSGDPLRGIKLWGTSLYTLEPLFLISMDARNIKFISTYMEQKGAKSVLGGSNDMNGAAMLAGPDETHADWRGLFGTVDFRFISDSHSDHIDLTPIITNDSSSNRMVDANLFNPSQFHDSNYRFGEDYSSINQINRLYDGGNFKVVTSDYTALYEVFSSGGQFIGRGSDDTLSIEISASGDINIWNKDTSEILFTITDAGVLEFAANGDIRSGDSTEELRFRNGASSSLLVTSDAVRAGGNNSRTLGDPSAGWSSLHLHDQTTGVSREVTLVNGVLTVA